MANMKKDTPFRNIINNDTVIRTSKKKQSESESKRRQTQQSIEEFHERQALMKEMDSF